MRKKENALLSLISGIKVFFEHEELAQKYCSAFNNWAFDFAFLVAEFRTTTPESVKL